MIQLPQKMKRVTLATLLSLSLSVSMSYAQSCSATLEATTAKYWQYRDNFNKHFILHDRDSSGCVGDGIGQDTSDSCEFSKAGYGLPATSIVQVPDGAWGMRDRNPSPNKDQTFKDADCAEDGPSPGTHWEPDSIRPKAHNYLEMGSETPHQMGWYWATLATEYELLRLNGQHEEKQRTLEEIFLGLQAYRRLDMQGQCLARKRYDEIAEWFEVEVCHISHPPPHHGPSIVYYCLCGEKYWGGSNEHKSFAVPCYNTCDWEPDLSGYSGFFLREDATQALEILHDPSEDKYNIDLVSSDYAMSLSPPCTSTFSQPCYLAHRQNYMSQDGVVGLLIGLALIKRYIPENAEVTTCDGATYKPHEMAKRITSSMVDRIDDSQWNRITFPGSKQCCFKEVDFSNAEGGRASGIAHGLKRAATYIDGKKRKSNADEYLTWSVATRFMVQTTTSANAKFWLTLKAIGWDMGEERHATKTLFHSAAETQNMEILILINNLLHPGGSNLSTNQPFFEELLCKAPCGGPCYKQPNYGGDQPQNWPEFDCPNEPEWVGQRWETHGYGNNRLFNGLDYMALHNIYRLHYNLPNRFYNPKSPAPIRNLGSGRIVGPDVLCPVSTGQYELIGSYPSSTISNLTWQTSTNLEVLSTFQNEADIRANAGLSPSYIQVEFEETRDLVQRYLGPVIYEFPPPFPPITNYELVPSGDTYNDKCLFNYEKPIITSPYISYTYNSQINHCQKNYLFQAIGLTTPDVQVFWKFEVLGNDPGNIPPIVRTAEGAYVPLSGPNIFPVQQAGLRVTLKLVTQECGEYEKIYYEMLPFCGGGMQLIVNPNPAQNEIAVSIVDGEDPNSFFTSTDPSGVRIRINPLYGGATVTDTQIYFNGESINIVNLQNGLYSVEATAADLPIALSRLLVVQK